MKRLFTALTGIMATTSLAVGQTAQLVDCDGTDIVPTGFPLDLWTCLDDYQSDKDVLHRVVGKVNFLNTTDDDGSTFEPVGSAHPVLGSNIALKDTPFRIPWGDRVGYAASGIGDVDGDGYNDWVTTWYDASPWDPTGGPTGVAGGVARAAIDAYVIPVSSEELGSPLNATKYVHDAQALRGKKNWDKVGFARVFSGRDGSQIGAEIWGHAYGCKFPHEVSPLKDIDGDGRDEVIMSSNTSDRDRGSVNVLSFTNLYNERDGSGNLIDTTERWVCVLRIVGESNLSQISYELEDRASDFNRDGQDDIVTASRWWRALDTDENIDRMYSRTGGGWLFLTPPTSVFTAMQASAAWPIDTAREHKEPIELIAEEHYNLCVMQLDSSGTAVYCGVPGDPGDTCCERVGVISDLADAGDLDGDGESDLVVTGGYTEGNPCEDDEISQVVGLYFLLSSSGWRAYDGANWITYKLDNTRHSVVDSVKSEAAISALPAGEKPWTISSTEVTVAIDAYQDSQLVIHGNASRGFPENGPGFLGGVNIGGTGSDESDFALVSSAGGNSINSEVLVLLDENDHFDSANGQFGQAISTHMGTGPVTIEYDTIRSSEKFYYIYSSGPDRPRIEDASGSQVATGTMSYVEFAGDYDGDGDMEFAVTSQKVVSVSNPNGTGTDSSTMSYMNIIDIGDTLPSTSRLPGFILHAFLQETPVYYPSVTLLGGTMTPGLKRTGASFGPDGLHRRGLSAFTCGDLDGDGRDDILMRAPAFHAPILKAPDPRNFVDPEPSPAFAPVELFDESLTDTGQTYATFRPYWAGEQEGGAGSTHIVLSPPGIPEHVSTASKGKFIVEPGGTGPTPNPSGIRFWLAIRHISAEVGSGIDTTGDDFARAFDHSEFTVDVIDATGGYPIGMPTVQASYTAQSSLVVPTSPSTQEPYRFLVFDVPFCPGCTGCTACPSCVDCWAADPSDYQFMIRSRYKDFNGVPFVVPMPGISGTTAP